MVVLGNKRIPNDVEYLLELGPKYSVHPRLDKTELVSLVRQASERTKAGEFESCVQQGVKCLPKESMRKGTLKILHLVSALKKADIKLLQSDNEGGFVLFPNPLYEEKVVAALSGNFRELPKVAPAKVKRKPQTPCDIAGLTRLTLSVRTCKALYSFERPRGLRNEDHHRAPCYLLGPLRPPTRLVTTGWQRRDSAHAKSQQARASIGIVSAEIMAAECALYSFERPRGLRNEDHHRAPCYLLGPLRPPTRLVTGHNLFSADSKQRDATPLFAIFEWAESYGENSF
ncbi:hypothetical protein HPB51_028986 [Rhipicephalus microplus]|uniref:Uncharacterized protein n=1 Tax=Rhipicephalus microplus TaxID=6941 RepID=A0A9J6CVF0_RHIMP|nr:hypothetical protein HPB51_028986 [Rhipicephalus microplus]